MIRTIPSATAPALNSPGKATQLAIPVTMKRHQIHLLLVLLLGGLPLASCQTTARARVKKPLLTCNGATKAARIAARKLGYRIVKLDPPGVEKEGLLMASRELGFRPRIPEADRSENLQIGIQCSRDGAQFDAVADGDLSRRLSFRNRFANAIEAAIASGSHAARPAPTPSKSLAFNLDVFGPMESTRQFGIDLVALGILPVSVELSNQSSRDYIFDPADLAMIEIDGERRAPLTVDEIGTLLRSKGVAASHIAAIVARIPK